MEADLLLDAPERRIIMDTKYYTEALGGRRGTGKLHSTNLYQLLAYLRNRQAAGPTGAHHEGILLYPEVDSPLAADIRLEGFRIQARTIDREPGLEDHTSRNAAGDRVEEFSSYPSRPTIIRASRVSIRRPLTNSPSRRRDGNSRSGMFQYLGVHPLSQQVDALLAR